jgi:hypothetical protein
MSDIQQTSRDTFFSQKNETMLQRLLNTDFQRRVGGDLNDKQNLRLSKTIKHYMNEVYFDEGNSGKQVQFLNKEVLQSVVPDYLSYLQRSNGTQDDSDFLKADVSTQFEKLQLARQSGKPVPPQPPSFQLSLEDDGPSSLSRFEQLKLQREAEARRLEEQELATAPAVNTVNKELALRNQSDDDFRLGVRAATQRDSLELTSREQARSLQRSKNEILDVPPDPRYLFTGDSGMLPNNSRAMGIANANPTLALPDAVRTRASLPQDNIKAQDDIISYRENEYNLFIYSADRDWVNNTQENRYNFSVNFDPANNRSGFGLSPSTYIKFKNISRIELVKVIMPTEAVDTLSIKSSSTAYDTAKSVNVFAYPYLQVRIDELNTNGFGTNDGLNNAFGVVSYDAYWASDTTLKNKGFTRLVPKFLKCQKIYYPTPLSTLQKMTIQIQKPDGTQYCSTADALDVSGVITSAQISGSQAWLPGYGGGSPITGNITSATYYDVSGEYLWIQTKTWFSQFTITQGDRVNLKNLAFPTAFTGAQMPTADFINFLTRTEGHIVVDIAQAYVKTTSMYFKDGANGSNKMGYSNFIIIRNNFVDPTTGLTTLIPFGGSTSANSSFLSALVAAPGLSSGRLMNLSHQIQLIFRVITRDMDSQKHLRPDNMY